MSLQAGFNCEVSKEIDFPRCDDVYHLNLGQPIQLLIIAIDLVRYKLSVAILNPNCLLSDLAVFVSGMGSKAEANWNLLLKLYLGDWCILKLDLCGSSTDKIKVERQVDSA